jgi:hypothetical protein
VVPIKGRIRSYGYKSRFLKNSSPNSIGGLLCRAILTAAITIRAIKFILRKRIRGQIRRLDNEKSLVKWRAKERLPLGSESSNLTKQITPPPLMH